MFLTKADLAKQLRVTPGAVDKWLVRGLPVDARGRFDRERALLWITKHVEPQISSSGKVRGAARASKLLMGSTKQSQRVSNGGNGHDAELANPALMRARRDRALAEKLEMANEITRGEVVHVSEAVTQIAGVFAVVRNRLLGMPAKIAPAAQMAAAEGTQAVRLVIEREILAVLCELSGAGGARDEAA